MKTTGKISVNLIFSAAAGYYLYLFWASFDGRWFNPHWTTDDAVQQIYPFWKVLDASLYPNDLITRVMEGYLAPLHYWLGAVITRLTADPIMTGHWMMFIQLTASLIFLFLSVAFACRAWPPALFACAWLLHTRTVIMRLTGGLPRGWALPLLAGFVYCVLTGRHALLLVIIGLGCLLNPPTTFLIAACYGIWLLFQTFVNRSEKDRKALLNLLLASPVFALTTWLVIQHPPEIGSMVNYEQAKAMPAFNSGGRFPFLPLPSISSHLQRFGYNPFINRLFEPPEIIQDWAWLIICFGLVLLFIAPLRLKRNLVPPVLWFFLLGIFAVYLASRQLLFYLYVPDRHLLGPLSIFLIVTFSIGLWNLFAQRQREYNYLRGGFALGALAIFVYFCSGLGFVGDGNFNYYYRRQGRAFEWLANHTDKAAVIAGHPTHVNPVTLFAKRKVYVSAEVAHPFYPVFYAEMERRLEKSLRAHYASSIHEFLDQLADEEIDYFVFSRQRFYGSSLAKETFYEPFNGLVRELTARDPADYAYKLFPKRVAIDKFPYMPFRDDHSVIIDLQKLRDYLTERPNALTKAIATSEASQ